jgi:hypothetical protein
VRRFYEQARDDGQLAPLLEKERHPVFMQSVTDLPPGKQLRVGVRSGHDIDISLEIDAGVPIGEIGAPPHEIEVGRRGGSQASVRLRSRDEIPNRDFVLRYRVASFAVASSYLAHRPGNATFVLLPPERAAIDEVVPRELVFLVDCSRSQRGAPLEKAEATILWLTQHAHSRPRPAGCASSR